MTMKTASELLPIGTAEEDAHTPPRGPECFANLAEWVASPDYAVITAQAKAAAAERKLSKHKAYSRRYYARKRDGLPLKAAEFCRIVFNVPTVPLLPAPGQVARWPVDTVYSPMKAQGQTPRRTRPDHHRPQWQIDAERVIRITPQAFAHIVTALGMTAEECAAYLRVTLATVRAWESGNEAIPFAAFWLLRVTYQHAIFKARFPQWDGWHIQETGPDAGKLIDANRCAAFTPQEIASIPYAWHDASFHKLQADRLQAKLDEVIAENTRLRQLFNSQGVTKELRRMQERLGVVLAGVGTADVVPYTKPKQRRALEKVA